MQTRGGRRSLRGAVLLAALAVSAYFAVPAWLRHGGLDRLIFVGSKGDVATRQDRAMTRPWALLPVEALVHDEYPLVPLLRRLPTVPVRIFQGTADDVTPFADIDLAVGSLPNVRLIPVPGGTHTDAYILAKDEYLRQLSLLLDD